MKKLISKLLWKLGRKLVTWSARLDGAIMPQTIYPDPYKYEIQFVMKDGTILTNDGPITLKEQN